MNIRVQVRYETITDFVNIYIDLTNGKLFLFQWG